MPWDPTQYLKFGDHRLLPALDLLARIDAEQPASVYDLGCGTGNVTRLIAQRWPDSRTSGIDSSEEMLARARTESPQLAWERGDLDSWAPADPADVIYSNAALHWIDGHARVFPALMRGLKPGGTLAVQMPRNFSAPSHTSISKAALDGPWRATLEPLLRPTPTAEPAFYYDILAPLTGTLDIWETEYLQVLDGPDPVKEWTKGTWLRPLLDALAEPDRTAFEAAYARLVAEAYPQRSDGRTLFPFRRLFIIAKARG